MKNQTKLFDFARHKIETKLILHSCVQDVPRCENMFETFSEYDIVKQLVIFLQNPAVMSNTKVWKCCFKTIPITLKQVKWRNMT